MKQIYQSLFIIIFMLIFSSSLSLAQENPWFDMINCSFCKNLTIHEGLLDNTTWEHYEITNGIVSITTVNDNFKAAYEDVGMKMQEVADLFQKGEILPLCNMCMAIGELIQLGIKSETVKTKHGDFTIMTSDKPEIIEKLKNWARRTNEEMEKMSAIPEKE